MTEVKVLVLISGAGLSVRPSKPVFLAELRSAMLVKQPSLAVGIFY